jgi:multiple sugar transport system permease protein
VLYVAPALIVIALVMLYPLIYTLVMGFFKNTLLMPRPSFAGLQQYQKLFGDRLFLNSIGNTLVWTIGSVAFQFGLGFTVAMLLHQNFVRMKTLLRILLMVPWVLPSIIGSSVWKWMYNADYGIINFLFRSLGLISQNQTWLSNPDIAMGAVIAVNAWKMFPFVLLMIEASLQSVSKDLKEAAIIDGAGKINIFRAVTLPAITPTCTTLLLLMVIWTLNAFTFIYNLTLGGPAHSTEVMAMYIYNKAFSAFDFGLASAASTVLFIISLAFSMGYLFLMKKNEEN